MAERNYEEMVIVTVDQWLADNDLAVVISQDTDIGSHLIDAYNDWYNDDVLLPVNQTVDEALTNGGYDELFTEDINDICDSILFKDQLLIQLMKHCYDTGFRAAK